MRKLISLICLTTMVAVMFCSCFSDPTKVTDDDNLMKNVTSTLSSGASENYNYTSSETTTPNSYTDFKNYLQDFSFNLFRESYKEGSYNVIAPMNTYLELSWLANGAQKDTKKQILSAIGSDLSLDNLNQCCQYFKTRLSSFTGTEKEFKYQANIDNALWCNDTFDVKKDFLTINANYYNIGAYRFLFSNENASAKIKNWLYDSSKIDATPIDDIDTNGYMYFTSTASIADSWLNTYDSSNIESDTFYGTNQEKSVNFLTSSEDYLESSNATGFVKSLKNTPLKFVAILPNEGTSISDIVKNLNNDSFTTFINSMQITRKCNAYLPEFSAEQSTDLTQSLQNMGITDAFSDNSNFGGLTKTETKLNKVTQNISFDISKNGICANANVDNTQSVSNSDTELSVKLNRPFIYAIIDNESNAPVYLGVMENI